LFGFVGYNREEYREWREEERVGTIEGFQSGEYISCASY
jgi:hypothetical protein